ncbi:MAG: biopolymer transporter ExbD [Deltaproteobacteria bacterium]|nr:biopolymer transporter ExbD [Deltaproteobacteria bacterium]
MNRRSLNKRRSRHRDTPELNITSFMNLMVVLVPFLLITAVFSRITILELSVPTTSGGSQVVKQNFAIEVIVRKAGLELANGSSVVAAIPNQMGEYDLEKLTRILLRLKNDYPEKDDATVLMEPDIQYDHLIRVMDTLRETEIPEEGSGELRKMALFPKISIGDAP